MGPSEEETKPENIDEYKDWLKREHEVIIDDSTPIHYDSVTMKIRKDFESSSFWTELLENLREYSQEYYLDKGYQLLLSMEHPTLLIKSFDSFLLKTYRKNVLENSLYPDEPKNGWILPNNWYTKITDIVRTMFVVKYLDGVEFFTGKIRELGEIYDKKCNISLEAREEGYYAAHTYIIDTFQIPKMNWDTEKIKSSIEIKVTTQLQETIMKMLHKYYEKRRKLLKKEEDMWQWNYLSDEFATNYLGHILHYVEGMIMEIREKQERG